MKDKFKKIIKTISEYNIFYSSVTITILLAVSQFYAYLKKFIFTHILILVLHLFKWTFIMIYHLYFIRFY